MAYKYYCFVFINNLNYCNIQNIFSEALNVCSISFFKIWYFWCIGKCYSRSFTTFLFKKTLTGFLTNGFFQASPRFFSWSSKYMYVCTTTIVYIMLRHTTSSDLKVNKNKGSIKKNKEYFMSRNISIYTLNIFQYQYNSTYLVKVQLRCIFLQWEGKN